MKKIKKKSEGNRFAQPLGERPEDLQVEEEEPLLPLPEGMFLGIPMHDDAAPLDPLTFAHELLTAEEERQLAMDVERGGEQADRARKRFMRCNQRLVYSIARKYQGMGVDLWDLIQEGNLGVSRAIAAYDYRRGFRFATYASWWIRQAIVKEVRWQIGPLHVPEYIQDDIKKLQRVTRELERELGCHPTREEQARAAGIDLEVLAHLLEVRQYLYPAFSLHHQVDEDDGLEFGDTLEDPHADVEEQVIYRVAQEEIAREVQVILQCSKLKPREQLIVLLHLSGLSLEEIGALLPRPITRERVRQIETVAYRKLGQIPELFALWQKMAS